MIVKVLLSFVIFLLMHLANLTEWLSYLSRPLFIAAAKLCGVDAVNQGNDIVLGQLVVPWSQDCSGANILVILWGVIIWVARERGPGWSLLLRLLLCIPAALLCNVLRICTLAGYRYVFYPSWESEELHFLVGFLWLIPFLFVFVDGLRNMSRMRWLELLHLSLILALIAPLIYSPGGSIVALCALFFLGYSSRETARGTPHLVAAYTLWSLTAVLISLTKMESLWIPWLLLCPRMVPTSLLSSWSGVVILLGTITVLATRWQWQALVMLALAYQVYLLVSQDEPSGKTPPPSPLKQLGRSELSMLVLFAAAPFFLPALISTPPAAEKPPPGAMSRQLTVNSYQLQLVGQPTDIRLYWYGPFGDGRHHSLENCMRFRGLLMKPVPEQTGVWTGGQMWMKDFFIHEHKLLSSYGEYLVASFSPFSSPGIHLIFDAPVAAVSPAYFAMASERLAKEIFDYYQRQADR